MATYLEIYTLRANTDLLNRVSVAIMVACEQIRVEATDTPLHKNRVAWAQQAINDPESFATRALSLLLAANKGLTTTQISTTSDAAIQTAVDGLVNTLTGLN
jgi:hypothetical protein